MSARILPSQEERVETGPVKFGEDWTGVFIRGDNALFYVMSLQNLLERVKKESPVSAMPISVLVIEGLVKLLRSSDERG